MKVSQAIPLSEKLSKKTSFPEKWKACFFIGMGYKNAQYELSRKGRLHVVPP